MIDCCFSTEVVYTLAKRLNVTVEYVDGVTDKTNADRNIQARLFANNYLNDDADVFEGSMLNWKTMVDKAGDLLDLAISVPYDENYELTALVPKQPKNTNLFNYMSVLSPSAWLLFAFSYFFYVCLFAFGRKAHSGNKEELFGAFFLFFKTTLRERTENRKPLVWLWIVAVALFLVEILKDQLLTQLTTKSYSYPTTFSELIETADKYTLVGISPKYLRETNLTQIEALFDRIIGIDYTNPTAVMNYMVTGKSVFVGGTAEILSVSKLLLDKSDKFASLDEKFIWSQYAFFVSKKTPFWRNVTKV